MNELLPKPNVELVNAACTAFDSDPSTHPDEEARTYLWKQFPHNTHVAEVHLKLVPLDKLYSTQIPNIHIRKLSRYIAGLHIDPLLEAGSKSSVENITNCPDIRHNYSFATKYCSWHNPAAYPIYDSNVDASLWAYKKRYGFAEFHRQDLWGVWPLL